MAVVFLAFAIVGAVVATGAPDNPVAWLMLTIGVGGATFGLATAVTELAILEPGSVPAASLFAWLATTLGWAMLLAIPILLQRFPSGRVLSPRWRRANLVTAAALVCWSALSFAPGPLTDYPELDNPFGIPGFTPVANLLEPIGVALFFVMLMLALASIVVRFRRSEGVERLQITWVAYAVAVTVVFWVTAFVTSYDDSDSPMWVLWSLSLCAVPLSIGVAIRRYRLYEIDRIVSRTLVYGTLTVLLGAVYAGFVIAGQWVFSAFAGGSNLAIAGSTLVVAALFLPLRSRVQHFVDRRFYRRRYDAQRTLAGFGARLREQVDLASLERDLQAVVAETMQPDGVSLWLHRNEPR
jgi:hypothetical protein